MNNNPIGIFDSGIGGLTVLDACKKILPQENFLYLSDSSHAPYGNLCEADIFLRVKACVDELFKRGAKAIVAACNTATNVGIQELRREYKMVFVGVEPALKPASEICGDGQILLLCTNATARQQKFKDLKQKYGGKNLQVLPQKHLAELVEKNQDNLENLQSIIAEIFEPYPDAKGIVLGCTHYVFLRDLISKFYAGKVKIFDGNQGVARQLKKKLIENNLLSSVKASGNVEFISL